MAVRIRLKRMGAKKKPFYRIVVADSRSPRDGRFVEEIGYYDPLKDPSEIKVDAEKAKRWIANGAQPTDTVKKLFDKTGALTQETPAPAAAPPAPVAAEPIAAPEPAAAEPVAEPAAEPVADEPAAEPEPEPAAAE